MVCAGAFADENRVAWPENYATHFVRYHSVDKPKVDKPAKIRFFYVNTEALARAKSGEPLPDGTILIMEDRKIVLGDDGNPMTDKQGRFIPTNEILSVIIQQKKAGWGNEYSEEIRNGDWEYAVFFADGTRKNNIEYDKCFACHKMQAEADYNFTFSPFLARIKP
jgi:hypothetical protein